MLQTTISALVNDVHITASLICLVTEFLGTPAPATTTKKKREGATAAGWGQQPTKNPSLYPLCASTVKEINRLYPAMDIIDFAKKMGIKYHLISVGGKGKCTNFGHLGRCLDTCPYKHVTCTIPDNCQRSIKEALEQGLAKLARNSSS
jgi:hypothetical protein